MDNSIIDKKDFRKPFVITFCSGKGGVGKSVLAANISKCLSDYGLKVLLWDADIYFPNLHLICGVEPPYRLREVYLGAVPVSQAIFNIDKNLFLLTDMPATGTIYNYENGSIRKAYFELEKTTDFDIIIFDAQAGATNEVIQCCSLADLISVIITDEPTSLLDAYGLIKILSKHLNYDKLYLLVNNVIDKEDADEISTKLNMATEKFLKINLEVLGYVPYDRAFRKSVLQQELLVYSDDKTEAIEFINEITNKLYGIMKTKTLLKV